VTSNLVSSFDGQVLHNGLLWSNKVGIPATAWLLVQNMPGPFINYAVYKHMFGDRMLCLT